MVEIVRLFPRPLIPRQVERLQAVVLLSRLSVHIAAEGGRLGRLARSELEHAVLLFRCDGPLGLHCRRLREILSIFSMHAARLAENVTAPKSGLLFLESVMEPAVVDPDLSVLRDAEDVHVTVTEAD